MGLIHIDSMEGHIGPFYWSNAYYAYETFIDPGDTESGFVGLECKGSFTIDWSGFLNDLRCIIS